MGSVDWDWLLVSCSLKLSLLSLVLGKRAKEIWLGFPPGNVLVIGGNSAAWLGWIH